MSTVPEGLKVFTHLGILSHQEAQAASGHNFAIECPFCGADKALGIALEARTRDDGFVVAPGMWRCFKCSRDGNNLTLLRQMWEVCKSVTGSLVALANDRGLPESILREYKIIEAPYTEGQYWVPVFSYDNEIANIYRYDLKLKAEGSKYSFIGCPGCTAGLFNVQTLNTKEDRFEYPIVCLEGHWDAIAWDHVLREAGHRDEWDVVATPGAQSFQLSWFRYFDGRPMILMYDHDPPKDVNGKTVQAGWDGIQRTIKLAKRSRDHKPSSISVLEWKA